MAQDGKFIQEISNCWDPRCARCPFTQHYLNFAMEQEGLADTASQYIRQEAF